MQAAARQVHKKWQAFGQNKSMFSHIVDLTGGATIDNTDEETTTGGLDLHFLQHPVNYYRK